MVRFTLPLALVLLACPIVDDDDAPDDDDAGADDDDGDDDDEPPPIELCGTVSAVDRASGEALSDAEWDRRAGGAVVYVLTDPGWFGDPLDKATLDRPGPFCTRVRAATGAVWLIGIADTWRDSVLGANDLLREHPGNPVQALLSDRSSLDIVFDIPEPSGGPSPERVTVAGVTELINLEDGPIAVTSHALDGAGPFDSVIQDGAGAFELGVRVSLGSTDLLGIRDKDGNGFFEPSDWLGEASANPIRTELGPVEGVRVLIPSVDPVDYPLPRGYATLSGAVSSAGFGGGLIRVFASQGGPGGQVYGADVLAAPGSFSVRAPLTARNLVVWAVLDGDSDGGWNLGLDPWGAAEPVDFLAGDRGGMDIELGEARALIQGTVTWSGAPSEDDDLYIGLYTDSSFGDDPVVAQLVEAPQFPVAFTFPSLEPGTYWASAYLDLGGDSPDAPGPGDAFGVRAEPIEAEAGQIASGVVIAITP